MNTLLLSLVLGFMIGGSLGLLGGGGSILTVPALVYLIGQSPQLAVTTSLAIVGANSALGASFHRAQGSVNWRVAMIFGGVGMIVSYFSAGLSNHFSPAVLMVAFALLMMGIGILLLTRRRGSEMLAVPEHLPIWKVFAGGAVVGVLTGILGVGGGFLIVPALVMLVGLPMRQAVGTSLVVIAMNSFAGFAGHLGADTLDLTLIGIFVISGVIGTFVGSKLANRIPAERLRQAFSIFVIALALFLLVDNVPKLFI